MGRFIVLEGGEAAGKSTQAQLLAAHLGATLTREPGGTALGEAVRQILLAGPSVPVPKAEALLMLAARAQHVAEVIGPALDRGEDVVCDRYSGSTLAYQGYGRGLDLGQLGDLDSWANGGCAPDLVVLLDVPVGVARLRRQGGPMDRFEGEADDFRDRARRGFLALAGANPASWRVVDATGDVGDVSAQVRKVVDEVVG